MGHLTNRWFFNQIFFLFPEKFLGFQLRFSIGGLDIPVIIYPFSRRLETWGISWKIFKARIFERTLLTKCSIQNSWLDFAQKIFKPKHMAWYCGVRSVGAGCKFSSRKWEPSILAMNFRTKLGANWGPVANFCPNWGPTKAIFSTFTLKSV